MLHLPLGGDAQVARWHHRAMTSRRDPWSLLLLSTLPLGAQEPAHTEPAVASATAAGVPAQRTPFDWAAALAAADPMFGGGAVWEFRLFFEPGVAPAGDPLQRARFLAERRKAHDDDAIALVHELATAELAMEALQFLTSDTGNAFIAAESLALGLYFMPPPDFPKRTAERYADADSVGPRGVARTLAAKDAGESFSPPLLAIAMGGGRLRERHVREIATFCESPAGRRWLDLRTRALAASEPGFQEFRRLAGHEGFLQYLEPSLDDMLLPTALPVGNEKPASGATGRARADEVVVEVAVTGAATPARALVWKVGGVEHRTAEALERALRSLRTPRTRVRIDAQTGATAADVEATSRTVKAAGVEDIRFPVEPDRRR